MDHLFVGGVFDQAHRRPVAIETPKLEGASQQALELFEGNVVIPQVSGTLPSYLETIIHRLPSFCAEQAAGAGPYAALAM